MDTIAPSRTCRNCTAALIGPYCAQCGQKDTPLDPPLLSVAGDAASEALDIDGKLVRSTRFLFTRPGFLTTELFAGRRATYVTAFKLYLVFSVILFTVSTVAGNRGLTTPPQGNRVELGMGFSAFWDEDRPGDREKTIAMAEELVALRTTWLPRAMFVVMPLLAVGVMAVTWGSRRHYPQHLQFTLHVATVVFAGLALVTFLPPLPPGSQAVVWRAAPAGALIRTVVSLFLAIYAVMAFRKVYGRGWVVNTLRTVVVGFMFLVLWNVAGFAILRYGLTR
jgi:Protein of unknown function (DUF3667)